VVRVESDPPMRSSYLNPKDGSHTRHDGPARCWATTSRLEFNVPRQSFCGRRDEVRHASRPNRAAVHKDGW
jgi:hypothetical protein